MHSSPPHPMLPAAVLMGPVGRLPLHFNCPAAELLIKAQWRTKHLGVCRCPVPLAQPGRGEVVQPGSSCQYCRGGSSRHRRPTPQPLLGWGLACSGQTKREENEASGCAGHVWCQHWLPGSQPGSNRRTGASRAAATHSFYFGSCPGGFSSDKYARGVADNPAGAVHRAEPPWGCPADPAAGREGFCGTGVAIRPGSLIMADIPHQRHFPLPRGEHPCAMLEPVCGRWVCLGAGSAQLTTRSILQCLSRFPKSIAACSERTQPLTC